MKLPLVSVVVPSYNHEKYVKECIESITSQSYSNFELIVIDDGSSDNSPNIIKGLAREHKFTYLVQANQGLSRTLNLALKCYAKGEYVILLASDDIMSPDRIKKQVEFMESNPKYGMSYSKALIIDENSKVIGESKAPVKTGWVFEDLFLAKFNIPAYTCIYRKEVLENVGYFDEEAIIEDSDILYKISKKYQIGYLGINSAYYRRHDSNTSKKFMIMYRDTFRRLDIYKDEPNYHKAVYNAKKHWFFLLSYDNKREAFKLFFDVLKKPLNKFFVGGCINLLGLTFITRKYIK